MFAPFYHLDRSRNRATGGVGLGLATHAAGYLPLELHDVPLSLPSPEFALYWHQRDRDDPGHRWLRDKIAGLLRP